MSKATKSGTRVGDWFLWIDCEIAKTDNYRKLPIVTLRKAVVGGDILSTVVATKQMADDLRAAANGIDDVINSLSDDAKTEATPNG